MAEDKVAAARAAADAADIPDVDEGGRPLTKKERTARQRAATKEREAVADAHASRMVPEVRRSAVALPCQWGPDHGSCLKPPLRDQSEQS